MSDDIVTRLREEANRFRADAVDIPTAFENCADEIERLRKDNRELLEIVKLFADYGQCVIADEFGDCVHIDGACEWHSTEHLWESFCMARGI